MKINIQYCIAQADLAHDLYGKAKGAYESVWMGAAAGGFKTKIADKALFAKCKEKATAILAERPSN